MGKYNREEAVQYTKTWAYSRNPKYYNFDSVGGDCTLFVSQCIYAEAKVMNYSQYGWYYKNGNNKSASWSGVEYLYKFLVNNKTAGPYGREMALSELEKGDLSSNLNKVEYKHLVCLLYLIVYLKSNLNKLETSPKPLVKPQNLW